MTKYIKYMFDDPEVQAQAFDDNEYCDFSATAAAAVAGKDIKLAVWNAEGTEILAIAGQQSLSIDRSAETIEVTTKDTENGWAASIQGMKEWSISSGGIYVASEESMNVLEATFENSNPVCIKVYNNKTKKGMFGGLAAITSFPLDAPYDDAMTYTIDFSGIGALTNFTTHPVTNDTIPE